jgi:hypothetical protein
VTSRRRSDIRQEFFACIWEFSSLMNFSELLKKSGFTNFQEFREFSKVFMNFEKLSGVLEILGIFRSFQNFQFIACR